MQYRHSTYNRIVVYYPEIDIRHIGTRDNTTLQELDIDIGIPKPKEYNFRTLEDCLSAARKLPYNEEGYVVVDKNWHRIKVKSPAYVAVHNLKANGVINPERIIELIKLNEYMEFLSYFPEYTEQFLKFEKQYNEFLEKVIKSMEEAECVKKQAQTRKDYALWATKQIFPAILFLYYDGKVDKNNIKEHINNIPSDKLLKLMGVKDE